MISNKTSSVQPGPKETSTNKLPTDIKVKIFEKLLFSGDTPAAAILSSANKDLRGIYSAIDKNLIVTLHKLRTGEFKPDDYISSKQAPVAQYATFLKNNYLFCDLISTAKDSSDIFSDKARETLIARLDNDTFKESVGQAHQLIETLGEPASKYVERHFGELLSFQLMSIANDKTDPFLEKARETLIARLDNDTFKGSIGQAHQLIETLGEPASKYVERHFGELFSFQLMSIANDKTDPFSEKARESLKT